MEKSYSKGEIASILYHFRLENGRLPRTTDYHKDIGDNPSYRTMCNIFETERWDDLIAQVFGIQTPQQQSNIITKEQVRDLLLRFHRQHQRSPRAIDIQAMHRTHPNHVPSLFAILKLFDGVWNGALEYAGLPTSRKSDKSAIDNAKIMDEG